MPLYRLLLLIAMQIAMQCRHYMLVKSISNGCRLSYNKFIGMVMLLL